jgi:hypothetical protein
MNEQNDLLQVVRAASPVLLRVIVLGAFFIYCTVSMNIHITRFSHERVFIFMRCLRRVTSSFESDNKAFSHVRYCTGEMQPMPLATQPLAGL